MTTMRPSLLPGLLAAVQRNIDRGFGDHALFEVGQIYRGDQPGDQRMWAGAVRAGTARHAGAGRVWEAKATSVDVYEAKADLGAVLALNGLDINKLQITTDAPAWYHPGRSGTLRLGPKVVLGHFGEVHPATLAVFGLAGPAVAFELDLDAVPLPKKKATKAKPALDAVELQPVTRDFAFVVDQGVASELLRAAEGADKKMITGVTLFDVFEGGSLGEGKKSLAIEVTLQPREKTLTDEEIEAVAAKVVATVKKATGGEIRG
jgi:phenylalanyl-tRNA synthetase beta chain